MEEKITYVDKEALKHTVNKVKEHVASNYATKEEIGNINTILDNINGEVV